MPGPAKKPIPSKKTLLSVYPKMNLIDAGKFFGVGQTTFQKWLSHYGIARTKKHRSERSEEHKRNLSVSQKGKLRTRSGENKACSNCGVDIYVSPARLRQSDTHYCSYRCLNGAKKLSLGSKVCPQCKKSFVRRPGETAANFKKKIYCSINCSTNANPPPVLIGKENPKYKGDSARRKQPRGKHGAWARKVLEKDNATCQKCGAQNIPLVAHHILSWADFPEKRTEVSNGMTLCNPCHFKEHGWDLSSSGVKTLENERGVETRKWTGHCGNCGKFIVKRASDMRRPDGTYRTYGFCSTHCRDQGYSEARKGIPRENVFQSHLIREKLEEIYTKDKIDE